MTLTGALTDLVDLVLPRRCAGCGETGQVLCVRCVPTPEPFAVPTGTGLEVRAAAAYGEGLRRAMIAFKERGRRDLGPPLALLLAAAVAGVCDVGSASARTVVLVAPPTTRAVAAQRGGDHVVRLARIASGAPLGQRVVVSSGVLQATRRRRDSAGLSIAERERNLAGSMRAGSPQGGAAIVVDDIVTTGATLREAQRALLSSGWPVLGAAVVAATPRRFTASPLAGPG